MRIPSDEFVPAQIGLTGDPLILHNMTQASKGSPIKRGTGMLVGFLLVLIVLAGLMMLYDVLCPRPAAFDQVENSFLLLMVNEAHPERVHISQMEACHQDGTYYYTVSLRVGDDPNVEQRVYYGRTFAGGSFVSEAATQELRSDYDSARTGGEQKVYTQSEIDRALAAIYDSHEKMTG